MTKSNSVSFFNPSDPNAVDNALALQNAQRKLELAELVKKQTLQPLGATEVIGGYAVKRNPLEFIARALQSKWADDGVENAQRTVVEQQLAQKKALSDLIMEYSQGSQPTQTESVIAPTNPDTSMAQPMPVSDLSETSIQPSAPQLDNSKFRINIDPNKFDNKFLSQFGGDRSKAEAFVKSQIVGDVLKKGGQLSDIKDISPNIQSLANALQPQSNIPSTNNNPLGLPPQQGVTPNSLANAIAPQQAAQPMPNQQSVPQANLPTTPVGNNLSKIEIALIQRNPEAYLAGLQDNIFKNKQLTDEQKIANALGISPQQQKEFYINKQKAQAFIPPTQIQASGGYLQNNNTGTREFIAPTVMEDNKTYVDPQTGKSIYNLSPSNNPKVQGAISQATEQGKLNAKYNPLQDGGKSAFDYENEAARDKELYDKTYPEYLKLSTKAVQLEKDVIPIAKGLLRASADKVTGAGKEAQNEFAAKAAALGIKIPNSKISDQQVTQFLFMANFISELNKVEGGSRGLIGKTEEDLRTAFGNLNTDDRAIAKIISQSLESLGRQRALSNRAVLSGERDPRLKSFVKDTAAINNENPRLQALDYLADDAKSLGVYLSTLTPAEARDLLEQRKNQRANNNTYPSINPRARN